MGNRRRTRPRPCRIRRAPISSVRKDLSMTTLRRSALSLALLTFFGGLAAAQAPSATVVGRVVDPTNAAVHGAAVRVRNAATNDVRTAQTQVDGNYTVAALPPGNYEVTVEKEG